jgi:peptidyl-prolyl cis-trans isomerase D
MVPEFESAAFSMAEGEVSDLVRTTYGFHIIKVTGRQTGFTRPLESVKDQIKSVLADRKAREAMARAVQAAEERLRRTGNLEALAQQYNLTTTDSPPFSRQEGLPLLGSPAEVRRLAFELKIGETSPSVSTPRGSVLFRVLEELPSRLPELEEVKARVRADLVRERATELSRARADELRAKLSAPSVKELAAAAKAAGVELKTAESFARTAPLPELGRSAALEQEAFRLEPGSLSPPIAGELGWVLVRVVERSGYSPERFAAERDSFTEQLVSERRLQVWNAFVQDLQQRLEIEIHRDALSGLS